jgi:hypothetical protein
MPGTPPSARTRRASSISSLACSIAEQFYTLIAGRKPDCFAFGFRLYRAA